MTPLVVLDVSGGEAARRLDIFPGGVIPAVFPASTPFWIGYGFAPDPAVPRNGALAEGGSRFELEVDGRPVETVSEMTYDGDSLLRETVRADFPDGLAVGWHELAGRWYGGGKLLLASRAAIEFLEP